MADLERHTQGLGSRPALLLIDMINGFTDPASPLGSECNLVVEACAEVLSLFRERGLTVVFTTVVYDKPSQAELFRARVPALNVLSRGSDAVEVDQRLMPRAGETLIEKHFASGFFQTKLEESLRGRGCDSLVVGGLTTSGCVRATVVDGLQHGFPVWVVREAVGDRNADAHLANLHDMHAKYADVVPLADLRRQLEVRS